MWRFSLLALLPPIYSVCAAAGLWTVYFISLSRGHISSLNAVSRTSNVSLHSPYISIAGSFPPASCIFSQVANMAAFFVFVIGLVRYLQLKNRLDKQWLNFVSMLAFSIACFGMTIIGNFQVLHLNLIHNLGTWSTFGLGTLYCWLQTYITLRANLKNEGRIMAALRLVLSVALTICLILKYSLMFTGMLDSVRSQWALVMVFLAFFATFAVEFRYIRFEIAIRDVLDRPGSRPEDGDRVEALPDQL